MNRKTLTVQEAAAYIGVSKDLIYQLVREGSIPYFKVGTRILLKQDSIDMWINEKEMSSTSG
ncbi:helix-turn-helix domain-containing protein [Pseudalkalibacillus hwajinpoensis]|uniref:helix-turn-helix domain-containing protein n=1 Tax=Guptibacillus hwajinpoensis TaxID=208199 RepID=UPI001CFC8DD7|nr:helix-turn-helix domain-containing protein [Pseudalkalibacillus hwajinpoensis]